MNTGVFINWLFVTLVMIMLFPLVYQQIDLTREINVLVLAYLGDTIYENYIRRFLINCGIGNVNDLQKEAVNYVSAKRQASYLTKMMDAGFLTDEADKDRYAWNCV